MLIDLHTHTINSFDGFSSQDELISACKKKGIGSLAITEHAIYCSLDPEVFTQNGIILIPGIEFTDDHGAHIIGLFVDNSMPISLSRFDIVSHIKKQSGIVIIPHPFKPGSGYFSFYNKDALLSQVDFIELINGGWNSKPFMDNILDIANEYSIKLISSSDSHKAQHVGLCVTKFNFSEPVSDLESLRNVFENIKQDQLELLIDLQNIKNHGRSVYYIQKLIVYQVLIRLLPYRFRIFLQRLRYKFGKKNLFSPNYTKIEF